MLISQLKHSFKGNKGFSLVELLIALLLGSVLLAMVIGLYVTGVSTGAKSLKYSRLRTDLQSIIAMMETDIRRAGYGKNAYLVGAGADKTIDINDVDITVSSHIVKANSCIVYYYNHNNTPAIESENKMAFRLNSDAIEFSSGVGKVANAVCATSGWTDISDDQFITITHLSFTENIVSSASATIRSVKIVLEGELKSDSSYKHSITTRVQVRNIEFN
ncbi:prepilin-type N-terminal cleavage/methylation domain-containing protein [Psychromonas hadalis]|uniref:prepilin-type N-terminal cleavage/methylation domain-containing protein n=1 Tax=Psychromonas hadalis TaxID=211669 RepID=UPI0003B50BFD|nr:prepilin-type N-terminal cleavage/methylation domain-containing protein [Psychromonas hadalis]